MLALIWKALRAGALPLKHRRFEEALKEPRFTALVDALSFAAWKDQQDQDDVRFLMNVDVILR